MRLVLPEYCKQSATHGSLTWIVFGAFTDSPNGEWEIAKNALSNGDKVQCISIDGMPQTIDGALVANPHIDVIACDVRDPGLVKAAVENCIRLYGGIDILVNWIDGGFNSSEFEQWILGPVPISILVQDEEETRKLMELNLFGLFNILQAVIPVMKTPFASSTEIGATASLRSLVNHKRILSISTTLAVTGGPGMGPYSASRRAGEGLLHTLGSEVSGEVTNQIFITLIDLGFTPVDKSRVEKLSNLLWELVHCGNPPCRISFGKQPSEATNNQLRRTLEEMEDWKYLFEDN
jgi:NAD(P)-dependent dehydrogenase (short-subunit alcohol dehydrogenase family)